MRTDRDVSSTVEWTNALVRFLPSDWENYCGPLSPVVVYAPDQVPNLHCWNTLSFALNLFEKTRDLPCRDTIVLTAVCFHRERGEPDRHLVHCFLVRFSLPFP